MGQRVVPAEVVAALMREIQSGIDLYPYHEDYVQTFPFPTRTRAQCIAINRFVTMGKVVIHMADVGRVHLRAAR